MFLLEVGRFNYQGQPAVFLRNAFWTIAPEELVYAKAEFEP